MKKLSILSICGLAVILLTGCTSTHKESKTKDYLSKETIEIPNKGKITIINQGASDKEYNNKVVLKLLVKTSNELQGLLTSFNKQGSKSYTVTAPNGEDGYDIYYQVYDKNENAPSRLKIENYQNNTIYTDKYYYPVINPNLNLGLDPEWFND
ncbi:hypothetical protein [Holzapfeliella floricola]|uniref:Lipoprotein n=1 Tax=Holzapfeliella floricola DSM 23037 = JCM 16512 TaxID=1423744 RepID=A0A0R2DUF5_9LACO|nr:hypothetical protein [Holzapfeliella floricola]KRN03700.1 hypothetical protein FC86_GL000807 [Holzapfeliella floricola DSM 23037 = JCM 16512]